MAQISITRALAEVKLIESKLQKSINICDVEIANKLYINPHLNTDELVKSAKANIQSVKDLYDRRTQIKKSIAKANVDNTITVNGTQMSLIEAIDFKNSHKLLLSQYNNWLTQFITAQKKVDDIDDKIETEVSNKVEASYGSNQQTSKNIVNELTEQYKKLWGANIVSGINKLELESMIQQLTQTVSEIDMCLSEANASIVIDI